MNGPQAGSRTSPAGVVRRCFTRPSDDTADSTPRPLTTAPFSVSEFCLFRLLFALCRSSTLLATITPLRADRLVAHGRLLAETVRDIRYVNTEAELTALGSNVAVEAPAAYAVDIPLAADD